MSGALRLRFVALPQPEMALVSVVWTNIQGSSVTVAGETFGPFFFEQDSVNPGLGILNLRTGQISMSTHYLISCPQLQASGIPSLPLTLAFQGAICPIAHFSLNVVSRAASGKRHFVDVAFLMYGEGTMPAAFPVFGGMEILCQANGCNQEQVLAPAPPVLFTVVANGISFPPIVQLPLLAEWHG
jgi:hypothetical protein